MDLVCNELSFFPLAASGQEAEVRFKGLIETFKEAKEKFGFQHIRFSQEYEKQKVTETENYPQWIVTVKHKTLQGLIAVLFRRPYTDDLEAEDLDSFYRSQYSMPGAPTQESPIGVPVAFIKALPVISFNSHPIWNQRILLLEMTEEALEEKITVEVFNICRPTDVASTELRRWADASMHMHIISENSEKVITKYLSYIKYGCDFDKLFLTQLFEWKSQDTGTFKRVLLLMKDIELHPFSGGLGKTENLLSRGKEASKRITGLHRLSYSIVADIVTFHACKDHYKFH